MNYVVYTAALFLLLSACSSNQPADVSQQHVDTNKNIRKTVETNPQQPRSPIIPIDGRLRDEHIQMYVSVKIKQEQIRYQNEGSNSVNVSKINATSANNTAKKQQVNQSNSDTVAKAILNEKLAIEEFEYNAQLYHWVKQTVRYTQIHSNKEGIIKSRRASNFEEYVLAHNLKMLEKHADELRFAANYNISPPRSMKQRTANANIISDIPNQQIPPMLEPAS